MVQSPPPEDSSPGFLTQFLEFIREQGVVGLAVAFVLGAAVTRVVNSIVNDIVNPVLGIFLAGVKSLENATVSVAGAEIRYGSFLSTLIDFLIIAFVVYILLKVIGIDKLDKKDKK